MSYSTSSQISSKKTTLRNFQFRILIGLFHNKKQKESSKSFPEFYDINPSEKLFEMKNNIQFDT